MRRWHGAGFEEHPTSSAPWSALAWSPAGDRLLAERLPGAGGSGATGIFLASADGAELGELTPGPASAPDWALTGQIAFARSDVYVMRAGGAPRRLTHRGGLSPSWSPNGKRLVFVRETAGRADVFVIRRDGRGLRRVTRRAGYAPAWSPDGRWIAFLRRGDIHVVRSSGSAPAPGERAVARLLRHSWRVRDVHATRDAGELGGRVTVLPLPLPARPAILI